MKYQIIVVLEEVDDETGETNELVDYTRLLSIGIPDLSCAESEMARLQEFLELWEANNFDDQ